jgi:hypothetical protein
VLHDRVSHVVVVPDAVVAVALELLLGGERITGTRVWSKVDSWYANSSSSVGACVLSGPHSSTHCARGDVRVDTLDPLLLAVFFDEVRALLAAHDARALARTEDVDVLRALHVLEALHRVVADLLPLGVGVRARSVRTAAPARFSSSRGARE